MKRKRAAPVPIMFQEAKPWPPEARQAYLAKQTEVVRLEAETQTALRMLYEATERKRVGAAKARTAKSASPNVKAERAAKRAEREVAKVHALKARADAEHEVIATFRRATRNGSVGSVKRTAELCGLTRRDVAAILDAAGVSRRRHARRRK